MKFQCVGRGFKRCDRVDEIITGPGHGRRNKALLRVFSGEGKLVSEHLVYPDMGYGLKVSVGRTGGIQ